MASATSGGLMIAFVLAVVPLTPDAWAGGKEYNQRLTLDPGQQAKVQRVIVNGRTLPARQEREVSDEVDGKFPNGTVVNTGCGKLSIGNVETTGRPGERLPRENIVVVRDVINVPGNCGTRR